MGEGEAEEMAGLRGSRACSVLMPSVWGGLSRPMAAPALTPGALLSLGQALRLPVFLPRTRGQAVLQGTA